MNLQTVFQTRYPPLTLDDLLVSAQRPDGAELLAFANAYEGGFSTCARVESRFFLTQLREHFHRGAAPEEAIDKSLSRFFQQFPSAPDADSDVFAYDPTLSFVAVWRINGEFRAAALGGEVARVWKAKALLATFPPEEQRMLRLPGGSALIKKSAGRDRRDPIAWTTLPPGERLEILSFRLAEVLGDGPSPQSVNDLPQSDHIFVACATWTIP